MSKLYFGEDKKWILQNNGFLFVEIINKKLFLRLLSSRKNILLWECEITEKIEITSMKTTFFVFFSTKKKLIGLRIDNYTFARVYCDVFETCYGKETDILQYVPRKKVIESHEKQKKKKVKGIFFSPSQSSEERRVDVSNPRNFTHVSHVGNVEFSTEWSNFLVKEVGVKSDHFKDKSNMKNLLGVLEKFEKRQHSYFDDEEELVVLDPIEKKKGNILKNVFKKKPNLDGYYGSIPKRNRNKRQFRIDFSKVSDEKKEELKKKIKKKILSRPLPCPIVEEKEKNDVGTNTPKKVLPSVEKKEEKKNRRRPRKRSPKVLEKEDDEDSDTEWGVELKWE